MPAKAHNVTSVLLGDELGRLVLAVLVLALIAGAISVWMILRSRRPALDAAAPENPRRGALRRTLGTWLAEVVLTVRYAGTRREWRYRLPWILLCGERAAGRSSIAASIADGRRRPSANEEKLPFAATAWSFFDRGVLIDVAGAALPCADDEAANRRWADVLRRLIDHRPERPLDGVVLAVSARTLLGAGAAERERLADCCRTQLWELQERLGFALPVYVVVTQCDAIDGYAAFWSAQPPERAREICGWSNPYALEHGFFPGWIDEAFREIARALKRLQLQAAASERDIAQADEFFLFPQRFAELHAPLRALLAAALRPSPYHAGAFLRGVYFTGSIAATGATAAAARGDVAFVERLFDDKVFAELHLARPLRQALWSRQRFIRRLQYAAAALFAALCLSLVHAGVRLDGQVERGVAALRVIDGAEAETRAAEGCVGRATVYPLLADVARLDTSFVYFGIPASWFDRRVTRRHAGWVADEAFEKVILPSIACHLQQHARLLLRSVEADAAVGPGDSERQRLRDYVDEVIAFEVNLRRFEDLATYSPHHRAQELMDSFAELAQYVYGEPLPDVVQRKRGQHREALTHIEYPRNPGLPADLRARVAEQLAARVARARREIDREIDAGAALLETLRREDAPILANVQGFGTWLERMRSDWLAATDQTNPCRVLATWLEPAVVRLHREYGYGAGVLAAPRAFDVAPCYEPARRRLAQLRVAPHGVLFQRGADGWTLAPAVAAEVEGFKALTALDYMQLTPREPFRCRLPLRGWRAAELSEAAGFIRAYQEFARAHAPAAGAAQTVQPLYLQLAHRQLRAVLDETMNRAQWRADPVAAGAELDALSAADQELDRQAGEFARVIEPLLLVLRAYRQLGLGPSDARLVQCARQHAAQALRAVHALSEISRLYEPAIDPAAYDEAAAPRPFFALGGGPQIAEYLDRQLQRAQVLASYAAPFVTFLGNTDAVGDPALDAADGRGYWSGTIQALNAFVQFKVPNGPVALLHDLFTKQLGVLTVADCADTLLSYTAAPYGNDLFSRRRRALEQQAHWQCHDRGRALAFAQYRGIARQFAGELAGRFPFGGPDGGTAPLAAARDFFLQYAQNRELLQKRMTGLKGEGWNEVSAFLARLDDANAFFRANLAAPDAVQPVRLDVEFRAAADRARGGENIVRWRLDTGGPTASFPNGRRETTWRYGDPVVLALDWAALAPVAPLADPAQPHMRVDGNTVSFTADGPWALLELIARHTPSAQARFDPARPGLVLLELRVPTRERNAAAGGATAEARVYVGLRFQGADPKTGAALALTLPRSFPVAAPTLW